MLLVRLYIFVGLKKILNEIADQNHFLELVKVPYKITNTQLKLFHPIPGISNTFVSLIYFIAINIAIAINQFILNSKNIYMFEFAPS